MRRWMCVLILAGMMFTACDSGPEVPLTESAEALFTLAGDILTAAEQIETTGFDVTAFLGKVEQVPASHPLAVEARDELRDAVNAFGSYAVGKLPNDYVAAMDYYEGFSKTLDRMLLELKSEEQDAAR